MKELDQKVFELIFSQNLTKAEAARALGVSDSNVRDSFERIIKFLKHPKNYYKLLHEGDKNYNFIMEFYKNNEEESIKR